MRIVKIVLILCLFLLCFGCEKGKGDEMKEIEDPYMKDDIVKKELSLKERIEALKALKPIIPIEGATFTNFNGQLPNAPRSYRHGYHEGIDFYNGFCCNRVNTNSGNSMAGISTVR